MGVTWRSWQEEEIIELTKEEHDLKRELSRAAAAREIQAREAHDAHSKIAEAQQEIKMRAITEKDLERRVVCPLPRSVVCPSTPRRGSDPRFLFHLCL